MRINFYLPDFFYLYKLNMAFIDLWKEHPERFYEGVVIKALYGAFPPAIWNGGRCVQGIASAENIRNTVKAINDAGVTVRYTYTNCLLEEKHLYDTFCNLTMDAAANGMNEVIINSPILEEYIRENYPTFNIISSTTKRLLKPDDYEKEFKKDYSMVVLDYALNNTDALFENAGVFMSNASRCEILVNAWCTDNCPMRSRHYRQLSLQQLEYAQETPDFQPCQSIGADFYTVKENRKSFVTKHDIFYKYAQHGYKNFKIEGRTMPACDVLESYLYYMVRPEHVDTTRLKMIRSGVV